MKRQPIVLVPACHRMLGDHPNHTVGKKYTDAVRLAGCVPLLFTAIHSADELDNLLDIADDPLHKLSGATGDDRPHVRAFQPGDSNGDLRFVSRNHLGEHKRFSIVIGLHEYWSITFPLLL